MSKQSESLMPYRYKKQKESRQPHDFGWQQVNSALFSKHRVTLNAENKREQFSEVSENGSPVNGSPRFPKAKGAQVFPPGFLRAGNT